MQELFVRFGALLEGAFPFAIVAALAWGVLSVVLSPCHLATLPLVVGFVSGAGPDLPRRRAVGLSLAFAFGMFLSLALVGAGVAWAGHALHWYRAVGSYVTAAMLLFGGLYLLDLLSISWSGPKPWAPQRKGAIAAVAAGLFLGVGLGPCTLAFVAPLIGVVLGASRASAGVGWALLLAFAVGHCAVVAGAGASTAMVQRWLAWNERSKGAAIVKRLCGALVLVGAASLVYTA